MNVDFVIITALEEERDALLAKLSGYRKSPPTNDDIRTYFSAELPVTFSDDSTGTYSLRVLCLLGYGRVQAANATNDAIKRWKPRYVLLVGIAGGFEINKAALGDLLVPESVIDYELQKITDTETKFRFKEHNCDSRLYGHSKNLIGNEWVKLITTKRPRLGNPKRLDSPVATGDKIVERKSLIDQLLKYSEKLTGVEMEAGGAASACFQSPLKPGFFMVRGVSDLADENKESKKVKQWRAYACDVAASYTIALLKSGPITLSATHNNQNALVTNKTGLGSSQIIGQTTNLKSESTENEKLKVDLESKPDSFNTLWNLPYPKNVFFTGREEVLVNIEERLTEGNALALTQAISGLGGMGKTQTAIEYAYQHRNKYKTILWVFAETEVTLISSYVEIAKLLNLSESTGIDQKRIVDSVKHWLKTNDNWLLIFDNADTPALLKDFLPLNSTGDILLTSRAQIFDVIGISKPLSLPELSETEALDFFYKRTGRQSDDDTEKTAVIELVNLLGYLPLALEQAGAYINFHQAKFQEYLISFKKRRLELLNLSPPVIGDYPESVSTTWAINFQKIEELHVEAADLLRISSFLNPDNIPLELIVKGASKMGANISKFLANVNDDPVIINNLLEPLTRYSLIRRDLNSNTYTIHRLVQEVVKASMDEKSKKKWAIKAVRSLNEVFPSASYDTWTLCERLLAHSIQGAELTAEFGFKAKDAGNVLNGVACYLRMRGDYNQSERLHFQSVAIRERDLGLEHPAVATCLNNLALVYVDQFQYTLAEPYLLRASAIWLKLAGEDESEDVAFALNSVGVIYTKLERYLEALPIMERAFKIAKDFPDDLDFFYAVILNNLAELHIGLGNYDQAEQLCKEGLEMREKIDNPEKTGLSYNTMATILFHKKEYFKSEDFFKKSIANREFVYNESHPQLLLTLKRYRNLLLAMNRLQDAQKIKERIDNICLKYSINDF